MVMQVSGLPAVSVILVSDHNHDGSEKSWEDERAVLSALARQDFAEPVEILLIENEAMQNSIPADLCDPALRLRVIFSPETRSAALKNYGVRFASADLVAFLDADCEPQQDCLRMLVTSLRAHPESSVVSCRTTYGNHRIWQRCLSVLDRGFDDLGYAGPTPHIASNSALYRRKVLEKFPYPPAATPFISAHLRVQAMAAAGHRFLFEPSAVVQHAIEGLHFVSDFRRNTGYADMMNLDDRRTIQIPKLLLRRLRNEWEDCKRIGPKYFRWYDWPFALVGLLALRSFEVPGMWDALMQRNQPQGTAFR